MVLHSEESKEKYHSGSSNPKQACRIVAGVAGPEALAACATSMSNDASRTEEESTASRIDWP